MTVLIGINAPLTVHSFMPDSVESIHVYIFFFHLILKQAYGVGAVFFFVYWFNLHCAAEKTCSERCSILPKATELGFPPWSNSMTQF